MNSPRHPLYVWQQPDWPGLKFDLVAISPDLVEAQRLLAEVEGKAQAIGFDSAREVVVGAFADEVQATAAIEGQTLSMDAVRSSVLRRLGLDSIGPVDRSVDGLVAVISDATLRFDAPLDHDRLHRWQAALFPTGQSGITRIAVGRYRDHEDPMQIVSGHPGREVVHFEAPPSRKVHAEMTKFLAWFAATAPNAEPGGKKPRMDAIARAAIAHLWFETIHPFEDGNGRIGRAIVDMAIAQHQRRPVRLYSLSRQLLDSRKDYYAALNAASRGTTDATAWVRWMTQQFSQACRASSNVIDAAIAKRRFWDAHSGNVNDRQRKVLQRLLDDGDGGFLGGLNAEKYEKMTGASRPTATRDLSAMVAAGQLWTAGVGKAVRYYVNMPGWTHGVSSTAVQIGPDSWEGIVPASLGGGVLGLGAASKSQPQAPVKPDVEDKPARSSARSFKPR
jgi:Fic family protein